jgi:hypothetical protein
VDKRVHGTGKLQKVSSAHIGQSWGGTVLRSQTSSSLNSLSSLTSRCLFPDVAQCRNAGAAILVFYVCTAIYCTLVAGP